jgi:hypothetical protein
MIEPDINCPASIDISHPTNQDPKNNIKLNVQRSILRRHDYFQRTLRFDIASESWDF